MDNYRKGMDNFNSEIKGNFLLLESQCVSTLIEINSG